MDIHNTSLQGFGRYLELYE